MCMRIRFSDDSRVRCKLPVSMEHSCMTTEVIINMIMMLMICVHHEKVQFHLSLTNIAVTIVFPGKVSGCIQSCAWSACASLTQAAEKNILQKIMRIQYATSRFQFDSFRFGSLLSIIIITLRNCILSKYWTWTYAHTHQHIIGRRNAYHRMAMHAYCTHYCINTKKVKCSTKATHSKRISSFQMSEHLKVIRLIVSDWQDVEHSHDDSFRSWMILACSLLRFTHAYQFSAYLCKVYCLNEIENAHLCLHAWILFENERRSSSNRRINYGQ